MPHQIFTEISEIVGVYATLQLAERLGGTIVQIPKGQVPKELEEILGKEAATKLCQHFGTGRLNVPKAEFYYRQVRDQKIGLDFYAGETVKTLALRWKLSERRINTILARYRDERQSRILQPIRSKQAEQP